MKYLTYDEFLLEDDGGSGGSGDSGSGAIGMGDASVGSTLGNQDSFYNGEKGSGDIFTNSRGVMTQKDLKNFQKKTKKLKTSTGSNSSNNLKTFLNKAKL